MINKRIPRMNFFTPAIAVARHLPDVRRARYRPASRSGRLGRMQSLFRRLFAAGALAAAMACPMSAHAADFCEVSDDVLIGTWTIASDGGVFEQMEFTTAGEQNFFNSWLHERPEISNATWTLQNCTLRITKANDPSHPLVFTTSIGTGQRLELREKGQPLARYRRAGNPR